MPIPSIGRAAGVFTACLGIGIASSPASAAGIVATWVGETGDWLDASRWDLEPVLATPVAPQNDGTNFFTVLIDGGSAVSSLVDLDGAVAVDRVGIDPGDTLRLMDGSRLTLEYDPARPDSGQIRNDGTLTLGSSEGGARLELLGQYDAHPTVEITGAGTIVLSDHAENFIGSPDFYRFVNIVLGEQQTLRGAGQIGIATNHGEIDASGVQPLVIAGGRLSNEGSLRAIGSGGLEQALFTDIYNSGLIEVEDGSQLISGYAGELRNFGTLRVRGAGAFALVDLFNTGLVEILDGATLSGGFVDQEFSPEALIRVGAGSTFETAGGQIRSGRVRIEDGLIRGSNRLEFNGRFSTPPRLEGIGRIEFPYPNTYLHDLAFYRATLATGLDGVGKLDVDGNVGFFDEGIWEVDLAGSEPDSHDRLAVSGKTTFTGPSSYGPGSRIDLAFLPGFALSAGDRIDILSAGSIVAPTQPLRSLFTSPDLAGDLYFAPEIAVEGAEQRLRLHVLEPIVATWTAGDGSYSDASGWSFSRPAAVAIPSNAGLEVFDVRIGAPGEDSVVALGAQAFINRLIVDASDALILGSGSRLILEKPLGRSEAREVRNEGTIALMGGELTTENGLAFSGAGTAQLSDDASNYIGALTDDPIDLSNGVGHTIAGAGSIRTTTSIYSVADRGVFSNAGTVDATGSNALFIDAHVENDGVITARGAGGIRISEDLTQRGLLRVAGGSRLELGRFRAFLQETDAALTELGPGAILAIHSALVNGGRVALDGGMIEAGAGFGSGGITIGATGLLEGHGTVRLPDQFSYVTVANGGAIAPGLSGIGRIEIDGGLSMRSGGLLRMDLAGVTPDLYDRIEVSGSATLTGLSVSLLDGFTPVQGDAFELFHAAATLGTRDIDGTMLGGGLFLVPEIHRDSDGVSLTLRAKREVTATWSGPSGDYFSPNWSFSVGPISASAPANDDLDIFDVEIGGSGPVGVALGSTARIESLSLGSGSAFDLGAGASLTITRTPGRTQSGRIANEGLLRVGSDTATAALLNEGDLEITGHGAIELGSSSSLGASGNLTNGADHTIRGAGRFGSTLHNFGLVEATSASPMSIGYFENDGTMRAIGAGGLSLSSGTNRGLIESGPGSSVRAFGLVNAGDLAVFGTFTTELQNAGSLDVHAGGSFTGGIRQTSEEAVSRIAGDLVAPRFRGLVFDDGLLELDGGSIGIAEPGLVIRSAAALIGDGAIRMQTAQSAGVRIEGELAPGHRGIGAIEIASAFSLARTGSISIQLSGTEAGSQHDLLTVLGTSILEGTIVVELLPSDEGAFAPAQGDAFDILIAQAIQNAGVAFDLPALDTGLGWETGIVADGGVARLRLLVVPEPGSATLLLFGLGLLTRSSARPGVCARSRSR